MSKITDEQLRLAIYAQINVDHQVKKISTEFNIKSKIDKGELFVIGAMFDIHGVYGGASANVYITNINGMTDISLIKHHPLCAEISLEMLEAKFKRV